MDASARPSGPAALTETHLSVVTFIGDRVYKLKKPVRYPFVDLRTRQAREALCRHEVERNRRLAPDVYEGVADVTGPDGNVCDHLVVMRRMPADRRLSTLVVGGDERVPEALDDVAAILADFHRRAARSPEIDRGGEAPWLRQLWRDNAAELRRLEGPVLPAGAADATLARAEAWFDGHEPLLAGRRAEGWICDGHGDLMADDIFVLADGPRILDGIEFDDRLCHGDVVADVAFLAMDLERLGAPEEAARFVSAYESASGASIPRSLLHVSIAYRAQVRAKVTALRAEQVQAGAGDATAEVAAARHLLDLCDRHLRQATVHLVLVGGSPGTGKTTVARALADRFGWRVLRSDVVRKQLAGLPETVPAAAGFHQGIYDPGTTDDTYRALLAQASALLVAGETVVLDASFTAARHRAAARELADHASATLLEVCCRLDADEAARRIERRRAEGRDASDADPAVAARLAADADPWPEALVLDTSGSVADVAARAVELVSPAV